MRSHRSLLVRRTRGFTLIELLVVVAIIALLLSILLPSLEGARAQARQVVCLSNLHAQGHAAYLYAEDNAGWVGRGIMGFNSGYEINIYATTVLKYLGYNKDPRALWRGVVPGAVPSPRHQARLRRALRNYGEQLQCPDFPDDAHVPDSLEGRTTGNEVLDTSMLDYVASAFPIPTTLAMIDFDVPGGGRPDDGAFNPEYRVPDYIDDGKLDDVSKAVNPARIIYVTEAHANLRWDEFRYHHIFLTSQLPFGSLPRIAADQRHPGGITALFFDAHAQVMPLQSVDVGWPNSLGLRLRWFTIVPEGYE